MQKRQAEDDLDLEESDSKKGRYDEGALVELPKGSSDLALTNVNKEKRVSGLQAPTMLLTGHESAIYSIDFDPSGQHIASASFDRQILLWDVYGDCKNYNVLSGHKNAVLQIKWGSESSLISCSADKSVCLWDTNQGKRVRRLAEHSSIVNSCDMMKGTTSMIVSGSDDCSVIVWDGRMKHSSLSLSHEYQITSVCVSSDGGTVYSGGIDNIIRAWDLRKANPTAGPVLSLKGHTDTITGLSLSLHDSFLLSNAMDSSLRCWDVRAYVRNEDERCQRSFQGGHHGAEKLLLRCAWSPDNTMVTCGAADRVVRVWDTETTNLLYYLPGHKGSVNEVIFHPYESVLASCGSDKQLYLGELS
mmetsp:Transcript_12010/g.12069  ORF Transcript_12010/g.12069 Transcript_12010/m.12069 type:complete len:359 (-) Transcript_12010:115-1191(-)|eukprot:CAMPEP_0182421056 /NCGR_PEP_ID=MMETSP1167-20130531/6254_1 /TAXON_ID=2988 /ORGANISM="Mallomonas Sp, Strain CCMP3275" /LENGTH=358 /DNA_ID=CAMNT_0024597793 /DNA_START=80 /DNA_END=1156 /DNA_ORIENTATION=-